MSGGGLGALVVLPGLAGHHPLHDRLEELQWLGRVAGVKGVLVVLVAPVDTRLVVGIVPVLVPGVAVLAHVVPEIVALELPVMLDDPVVLPRYVGSENRRSDLRVIVLRDDLPDVVEQCDEDGLIVGAVLIRPRVADCRECSRPLTGPPSSDSSICFSMAIREL